MTTPELLAACRAELERQKAVGAAAHPVPWVDLTESLGSIVSNPPGNEAYSDVVEAIVDPDDAAEIVQARNHDPARLAVAEDLLLNGESWLSELRWVTPRENETRKAIGHCQIARAAKLLGVAVD